MPYGIIISLTASYLRTSAEPSSAASAGADTSPAASCSAAARISAFEASRTQPAGRGAAHNFSQIEQDGQVKHTFVTAQPLCLSGLSVQHDAVFWYKQTESPATDLLYCLQLFLLFNSARRQNRHEKHALLSTVKTSSWLRRSAAASQHPSSR